MKKEELENIISEQKNLKNLPNSKLIEYMDKSTYFLDKLEELYNNILKEYQDRAK